MGSSDKLHLLLEQSLGMSTCPEYAYGQGVSIFAVVVSSFCELLLFAFPFI